MAIDPAAKQKLIQAMQGQQPGPMGTATSGPRIPPMGEMTSGPRLPSGLVPGQSAPTATVSPGAAPDISGWKLPGAIERPTADLRPAGYDPLTRLPQVPQEMSSAPERRLPQDIPPSLPMNEMTTSAPNLPPMGVMTSGPRLPQAGVTPFANANDDARRRRQSLIDALRQSRGGYY